MSSKIEYTCKGKGGRLFERRIVYTAPPELAELKALIADALAVNKTLNQQMDALQATIAQQAAEIERLKGGQREQFDMAVSALNDIVKVSRMGGKPFEIATLALGEMSAIACLDKELNQ